MGWFLNNIKDVVYNLTTGKYQYCINGTYINIPDQSVGNISILVGSGLLGGTITSTGTISMPNVGTAGTYGNSTQYPIITTDTQGRVSNVTLQSIATTGISINGQTGNSQTFANDSQGNQPNFFSSSNVHTLNIPLASTINVLSGTISNADYQLFSNNWGLNGNTILSGNFIGSINNQSLKFKTNNAERMNISALGFIGMGITPGSIDKLEVNGNIKATGSVLKASSLSLGLLPSNGFIIDAYNPGIVTERISTNTDPLSGSASARTMYTFDPNTGAVNVKGWRLGLNTGGIPGGYTPSYDYTIDELSSGAFHNVFKIKFSTNLIGINMGNLNEPTSQLDVNGDARIRNLAGIGTRMVVSDANGVLSTQAIPSGGGGSINFADEEIPSGTMDSINTIFTLTNTPTSGSLKLYLRGIRLKSGVDFTLLGLTITMIVIPDFGDNFIADYRY